MAEHDLDELERRARALCNREGKDAMVSIWGPTVLWLIEQAREAERLREALEFYADPETYFAIGFWPDPPCGAFIDDGSETMGLGMKPGKRARIVLGYEKEDETGQ